VKNKNLTIGISTLSEHKIATLERAQKLTSFCNILVVVQDIQNISDISIIKEQGVTIVNDPNRGLSRSRNLLVNFCETAYLLIGDDDQTFLLDGIQSLYDYFCENHELGCITGKVVTPDGIDFKPYASKSKRLNKRNMLSVSSIEMMLNVQILKEKKITFDERFGLGSPYLVGEEGILLIDLLKANIFTQYLPIYMAKHSHLSSGEDIIKKRVIGRGASFFRMFGWVGFLLIPIYTIKQRRNYKHQKPLDSFVFFYWVLKGFFEFSFKSN
tara:strand:- start:3629 stop:4438 length:810 start_codon:yes stop_codon:yes gene_type:complete